MLNVVYTIQYRQNAIGLQVATMYHDATIGNAINIVLVRVIYLEQDEVGLYTVGYTACLLLCIAVFLK